MQHHLFNRPVHPFVKWAIVGLHLCLLGVIYARQGIADDKEALKYLGCANDVLHADLSDLLGRYRLFATYVVFLLPFVALGIPHLAVVVQVAIGIAAAFALKRLVQRLGVSSVCSTAALAVFLLAYTIQTWVITLYSEALFTSLCVLFIARAFRGERLGALTWVLAVLVVFARPTGLLFVLPVLLWKLFERVVPDSRGAFLTIFLGMLTALLAAPVMNREQLAIVVDAHVICGFPERPGAALDFTGRTLAAAQAEGMRKHGAGYWSNLFLRRMVSFFNPTRPYFSVVHNAMVLPVLLLYPLAILGAWRYRRSSAVNVLTLIIVLNALLVGLTYDEWNARFLAPVLPCVIVLAALCLPRNARWAEIIRVKNT